MLKLFNQKRDTLQVGICFSPTSLSLALINKNEKNQKERTLSDIIRVDAPINEQIIYLKENVERLKLQGSQAVILLPFQDYRTFLISAPKVQDSEKKEAIHWKVAEYIDFPIEDAVVDYIELPSKSKTEDAEMLYVIVTKKSKIEEIASWVKNTGLTVKSVDIIQSALRKIAMNLEDSEEGQALLHMEDTSSHLIIFKNKTLYMMRDLDIGLRNLEEISNPMSHQLFYHDLSLEIQKSLDYCASNLKNAGVTRLVVTPISESRPQFLSNLSDMLGLPVREMLFSEFLTGSKAVSLEKENLNVYAIGAALS